MSNVQQQGEALKKAIQWVSDERRKLPDTPAVKLANDAALRFDLSPKDSDFLLRFVKEENQE
ncbi:MAG: hypothetical protein LC657_13600 [Desulfobacteraceae bacterium]|nr:hypothetical protein [Desulfobacteraceae bacterium]